ncbi:hypothetical protein [Pseudomonas sp. NPDC085632]|uniref:hypothetical protein n=1 Tax=Pseudomonas sp. NPDC085632 TaxID=3364429 RepID=UPI0037C71011
MAITRSRNETQQLYPAKIALATNGVISEETPPDGVPVQGVPLGIFKEVRRDNGTFAAAVQVLVDPPMDPDQYDEITLWLNGVQIGLPQQVGNKIITFNMFQSDLRDGITNVIQYKLKRHSGNQDESTELWALYSATLPGGNDVPGNGEHPGLGISLPADWGDPANIDKDKIDNKVPLTLAYSHMKAHDKVTVEVGNERFDFTVKPGEVGASFVALIDREQFELVGSQDNCPFSYTVVDQLLNAAHKRRWSKIIRANVDVDGVTLGKPILREILDDSEDEATEIDLGKLAGKELLVVVLTSPSDFKLRDKIEAEYIARLPEHPDVVEKMKGTVEADEFGEKKRCILKVPYAKVIAGSSVTVTYALFTRDDHPVGRSETATATVVGEALPPAVLGFTNAPYAVSAGGELGPVNLRLTRTGAPVANVTVGLTLPAGFTYSNGGGGARDFTTDAKGEVSVTGVKGAEAEGEFELVAVSMGAPLVRAQVVVLVSGPVGVIDMGAPQNTIAISRDGTRVYVELESKISVIDTRTNIIIGHILKPAAESYLKMFITPDGKKLYAGKSSKQIHVFDAVELKFFKTINLLTSGLAMSRDGTKLASTHQNTMTVIETTNDTVVSTFSAGRYQDYFFLSPDGSSLFHTTKEVNGVYTAVYKANTMTGENTSSYQFTPPPGARVDIIFPFLSSDGTKIYANMYLYSYRASMIIELSADTLQELRRFEIPNDSYISQISSDRIYLEHHNSTRLAVVQIDSGEIINHIEVGRYGQSWVGFSACTLDEKRLYVSNRSGPLLAVVATGK